MCMSKIMHALAQERAKHALLQISAISYCLDSETYPNRESDIRYLKDILQRLQDDLRFLHETVDEAA